MEATAASIELVIAKAAGCSNFAIEAFAPTIFRTVASIKFIPPQVFKRFPF
jgi:hypothetical protein